MQWAMVRPSQHQPSRVCTHRGKVAVAQDGAATTGGCSKATRSAWRRSGRPTPGFTDDYEDCEHFASTCSHKTRLFSSLVLKAITSTGLKKGEQLLADVSIKLKNNNITTDIKVDSNSNYKKMDELPLNAVTQDCNAPVTTPGNQNPNDGEKKEMTGKNKRNLSNREPSAIWDHFVRIEGKDPDRPRAACKYCGREYGCHSKNDGTSNMWGHLKNGCV
ncbi:hypothetical protein Tsubulata_044551 [Turnera subulata]|uniref:BED-type domain-containing protein n=1 Tax=Turnera subulata TaxID=218843 RepID=A0A9Q0GKM7_9ROSI|nr:hypothetical protein Tsubulata_044551 [Turnera subulata]